MNSARRAGRRHSWTAIFFVLVGLSSVNAQFGENPPLYNYDTLPETRFTCEGRLTGGYYADPETDCQLFHVCAKMSRREVTDFKFLCPNGTVFDQEHQVCADYYQVVCHSNVGTNPLGQNFEIFKLTSKESTNQREFGNVPVRDPDYLGQNSLGTGEDFQAAENNNNGLASSRNAIQYQAAKSQSRKESIFYQPTTTRRTTTPPPTTTQRVTRPQPPTTTATITTTQRTTFTTSTPNYETRPASRQNFQTVVPSAPAFETRPPPPPPRPTTTQAPPVVFRKPVPTEQAKKKPYNPFGGEGAITDFASLLKFQSRLHGEVTHPPRTSTTPTTTVGYTSTTYAPYTEYTNYPDAFQTTTTRRPSAAPLATSNPFSNFASLSKFQAEFHKSFAGSTPRPTTRANPGSTPSVDFNTRPRSETQAPSFPTTKRPSVYQSTFRTTFADITTLRPTFQQQPTRFNEDFFKKVESQNQFLKTNDEDDYEKPRKPQGFNDATRASYESTEYQNSDSSEPSSDFATQSSSSRPVNRGGRRRVVTSRQRSRDFDPEHKFSRRVQSARFEDRETYSVRDRTRSNNEEIFDAEASVFRGPADINNFYEGRGNLPSIDQTPSAEPKPQPVTGEAYGRRIRPSRKERVRKPQDSDEKRQGLEDSKPVKRLRQRPSTTTTTTYTSTTLAAKPDYVSATTYRPSNQFHQVQATVSSTTKAEQHKTTPKFVATTTPEPELVTASDEERENIRIYNENLRKAKTTLATAKSTTYKPTLLSLKVTSKTSFSSVPAAPVKKIEKPVKKESAEVTDSNPTKNPDYDYTYYDTDQDADYADFVVNKPDKYGKKSNKVIIAKS